MKSLVIRAQVGRRLFLVQSPPPSLSVHGGVGDRVQASLCPLLLSPVLHFLLSLALRLREAGSCLNSYRDAKEVWEERRVEALGRPGAIVPTPSHH